MKYNNIHYGIFQNRPNRFIANVEIDGNIEKVHVKNTGRCKEILLTGCEVFLSKSDNADRKTKYDLVAVIKNRENSSPILINIDSQAPNEAVFEWLHTEKGRKFIIDTIIGQYKNNDVTQLYELSKNVKILNIRREVFCGKSRIDFAIDVDIDGEQKILYIEVKGVTLENSGKVFFPDAPTTRGIKHIFELMEIVDKGNFACVLFVVQMKGVDSFSPNDETQPEFGSNLKAAKGMGVSVQAVDCIISKDSIEIDSFVKVKI